MAEAIWTWAQLDERALALVDEAERTLGADYVVVYREGEWGRDIPAHVGLPPAPLDASQLECLQGFEGAIEGVAVAYRRA